MGTAVAKRGEVAGGEQRSRIQLVEYSGGTATAGEAGARRQPEKLALEAGQFGMGGTYGTCLGGAETGVGETFERRIAQPGADGRGAVDGRALAGWRVELRESGGVGGGSAVIPGDYGAGAGGVAGSQPCEQRLEQ